MKTSDNICVFGGSGMLGSAIVRRLNAQNYNNIDAVSKDSGFDLLDKNQIDDYFKTKKTDNVFMVAGLVGGIFANNSRQADFLYQNALMILYVLDSLKTYSPETKILYTGSTCIYPKENPQPINENRFMTGPLEETNKGYAVAKGTGVIACQLYRMQYGINAIAAMPTNMYGPNDNYDLENSHFIAAMIKKLVMAKTEGIIPVFWGTGKPRREAMYVEDCADALIYLMQNYNEPDIVNIGTGFDYSVAEYIKITSRILDYKGEIQWDPSKPDGMLIKQTDISKLKSIMPEYKARRFEDGLKIVLKEKFGIQT
ncbi:MAG: NAD-dependent epimerase/dehydratase family protein [Ignavibacteriae bacterium]|nr:NAD-dependent epimerase/dehydratase family protein [Ignavibacteriota bacterium]